MYADPNNRLVAETLTEDAEEMDDLCGSVSGLSVTSSPASGNDSNMVSPDQTHLSPMTMRSAPTADRPCSKNQSRTDNGNKTVVCCLDKDLASTKHTAAPLEQSSVITEVDKTSNTTRTKNK